MTCQHNYIECPIHEGNFDCTPFCPKCEGFGEYCRTCGENWPDEDEDEDEDFGGYSRDYVEMMAATDTPDK